MYGMLKMFFLGLCILCIGFSSSEDACSSQTPCRCVLPDNTVIDLSSVGSSEFVRFYGIPFPDNCSIFDLYSYNPCFAFDSPDKQTTTKSGNTPCTKAAACVKSSGGTQGQFPEEHSIGLQKTGTFGKNDNQFHISYTLPGSEKTTLKVILDCDEKFDQSELQMVKPECNMTADVTELLLKSKCACPNGCKSSEPSPSPSKGLSTGSKLLIAFFTILLAYLIIGIVWNYCNGSRGAELIPNFEFWNGLPSLIMEGVAFACSCCINKSSYGEV